MYLLTSNGIPKQVPWVNWSPYVTKGRLLTLESFDHRDYHQLNLCPIKTSKTRLVISVQYHSFTGSWNQSYWSTFVFSIVPTGKFLWVEPVLGSAFCTGKRTWKGNCTQAIAVASCTFSLSKPVSHSNYPSVRDPHWVRIIQVFKFFHVTWKYVFEENYYFWINIYSTVAKCE